MEDYNLACILTLPCYQRRGYGKSMGWAAITALRGFRVQVSPAFEAAAMQLALKQRQVCVLGWQQ